MNFDHLDDPLPFEPDTALRAGATRRGRHLRNRRRLALSSAAALLVVLMIGTGFTTYERNKAQNIVRIDLAANLDPVVAAAPEPAADDAPPPTDAINILVVGSDSNIGGVDRPVNLQNTDTMMVVRIDPTAHHVNVVSLPRDLWVAIPGHGHERLNTAWETGGPALLIDTIKADFGIPIHHFLQVDGQGFQRLVDQGGGVDVYVTTALRDGNTGFAANGPACAHLDGAATLALSRSRHLEARNAAGQWREDPRSDLGRIDRQQVVGRALVSAMLHQAPTPAAANTLLDTLVATATLDTGWSLRDMAGLIAWARGIDQHRDITTVTPPTRGGYEGQAAVLHLDEAAAAPVFAPFRGQRAPAAPTSTPSGSQPADAATPGPAGSSPGQAPTTLPGTTDASTTFITATRPDGTPCP